MSTSTYSQGYHASVTRNHASRTAESSAAFLLPHLQPHHQILDIGCGPGSITSGLANRVPQGHVTGIDISTDVLSQATALSSASGSLPSNLNFELGNVLEGLKYPDASFDVVYNNQVLTHLPDPVTALKEMKRVCKPGGVVASRAGDFPHRWYPFLPGIQLWDKYIYLMVMGPNSLNADFPQSPPHDASYRGGAHIHVWARQAGFEPGKMVKGGSALVSSSVEERRHWGGVARDRVLQGEVRERYLQCGATEEDIEVMVRDLKRWEEDVDGWFAVLQCEVLCWV